MHKYYSDPGYKKKMSDALKKAWAEGRRKKEFSKEHKANITKANIDRYDREEEDGRKGRRHKNSGHKAARRIYHRDKPCESCCIKPKVIHRHHKNGNTLDNRPENIVFLCPSCHGKLHGFLRKGHARYTTMHPW